MYDYHPDLVCILFVRSYPYILLHFLRNVFYYLYIYTWLNYHACALKYVADVYYLCFVYIYCTVSVTLTSSSSDCKAKAMGLSGPQPANFASTFWKINGLEDKKNKSPVIALLDTGINAECFAFKQGNENENGSKILTGKNYARNIIEDENNVHDLHGHGTACAAIAAGMPYEYVDEAGRRVRFPGGVAPNAKLLVYRIGDSTEAFPDDAVEKALSDICDLNRINCTTPGIPYVDVVSMSFGSDRAIPKTQKLIDMLKTQGTICIAAVGNSGKAKDVKYPAYLGSVIGVGSISAFGHRSEFSNEADTYALGQGVLAPWQHAAKLQDVQGSSMAAPAIAGLVARLIEYTHHHFPNDADKLQNIHNTDTVLHRILKRAPMVNHQGLLDPERFFFHFKDNCSLLL